MGKILKLNKEALKKDTEPISPDEGNLWEGEGDSVPEINMVKWLPLSCWICLSCGKQYLLKENWKIWKMYHRFKSEQVSPSS